MHANVGAQLSAHWVGVSSSVEDSQEQQSRQSLLHLKDAGASHTHPFVLGLGPCLILALYRWVGGVRETATPRSMAGHPS